MDIKNQNKKFYQKPEIELCYLELSDVIVCSSGFSGDDQDAETDWTDEI